MSDFKYSEEYFNWQKTVGEFGGKANLFKFQEYITVESLNIIDFGCGGGYLLDNIKCKNKIGTEINDVARENAQNMGINVFPDINFIEDEWADLIISNHALEHANNPLDEIKKLKRKLKNGGKFVCVVPHETSYIYSLNDVNQHLFTWAPQNLLNLFSVAGYRVEKVERIFHSWPSNYLKIQKILGWKCFHLICRLNSKVFRKGYQTRIVGVRDD